jgi:DNA (cytosine-5)-methyltransferase 1
MNHASLFSGIGGFDLAAEWMGWNNVLHVERDPFCQKVIKHHFPNSQSFDDVKTFDGRPFRGRVDILTGGFPCQPYSSAGKRLGKDDERHLWPEMCRIISEIAPAFVVGENVRGLLNWNGGVVFEEVCADLEALGYEVWTGVLPAAGVGAPHRRDRVWWVAANADRYGSSRAPRKDASEGGAERLQERDAIQWTCQSSGVRDARNADHAASSTLGTLRGGQDDEPAGVCQRDATDTHSARVQGQSVDNGTSEEIGQRGSGFEAVGDAGCVASWDEFPTQPPVCGGDDGLPRELDGITFSKWRAESIKSYGNAIVPQVAYQIFQAIQQTR